MPIVFVHGVNTRQSQTSYKTDEDARNDLFHTHLSHLVPNQAPLEIYTPYWGKFGVEPKLSSELIPSSGDAEKLGAIDDTLVIKLNDPTIDLTSYSTDEVLLKIAQWSLVDMVNLLFTEAIQQANIQELSEDSFSELVALACEAQLYVQQSENNETEFKWLKESQNNDEFFLNFRYHFTVWQKDKAKNQSESPNKETLGGKGAFEKLWGPLEIVFRQLERGAINAQCLVIKWLRQWKHEDISLFSGDGAMYIMTRGEKDIPGPIVQEIIDALEKAKQTSSANDPLILIAHSMGGNISYDILSYYRPDIQVDVLVTVGSQVSQFSNMGFFKQKEANLPKNPIEKVPPLSNVKSWLNIYNTTDFLSFPCEPVFNGVKDHEFSTLMGLYVIGVNVMGPHSAYFSESRFYERLALRLKEVLLLP